MGLIKKIVKGLGGILVLLFLIVLTHGWILAILVPYMVGRAIYNHYKGEPKIDV